MRRTPSRSATTKGIPEAEVLFARHLDLRPLRGRRRGCVQCVFHSDHTPSLSVDLDRGLFHCFACGVGGGVKRFAQLVGEPTSRSSRSRVLSPLAEARQRILTEARRQPWARPGVLDLYRIADSLRSNFRFVGRARRAVTVAGEGAATWELLGAAASVERVAFTVEAALEEALA